MGTFVGLDVSLKETSVCILDQEGTRVFEGKVASEPAAIIRLIRKRASDLGSFAGVSPATHYMLQLEREYPGEPMGSVFFRVYADPLIEKSDVQILSRLEYQGTKGFYVLTRQMQ